MERLAPFAVTHLELIPSGLTSTLLATTDRPEDLSLALQRLYPTTVPRMRTLRGRDYVCGFRLLWAPELCIPQNEPGEPLDHTFTLPNPTTETTYWATLIDSLSCALPNPSTPPFTITLPGTGAGTFHATFALDANLDVTGFGPFHIPIPILVSTDDPLGFTYDPIGKAWRPVRDPPGDAIATASYDYSYGAGTINVVHLGIILPLQFDTDVVTLAPPGVPGHLTHTKTMANIWDWTIPTNGISITGSFFRPASILHIGATGLGTSITVTYTTT